ncbi:glycosyltransferase [Myxacorys almedinensis]|uniref:Glycosyltransferase n=1 Tax=Myxacorys almedinensis A TaxID=2690445 RepID=A0A8J7YZK6_9CYAN|nr:glycosyltransferase [Myxacorys almedinensis]NDJ16285.1 glycosyltransferase [Myxacorys almedinensis A]
MRIGIDIQALQTENSRNRGIGRYTRSVIENLLSGFPNNSYHIFANRTLRAPDIDPQIYPYTYVNYEQIGSSEINDLLLKTTFSSDNIDAVFIPSPMEELDATIPSYKNFCKQTFVICYDLIPLLFQDRYLSDPTMNSLYMKRLLNVQNADFIFAISESTRQDAIKYLNVAPDKVLNVSGGVSSFFKPIDACDRARWLEGFAQKFGITKPFILYTGGEDWRKNIEGLVKGFSKLPTDLRNSYELVIACKVSDLFARELKGLASSLGIEQSFILTNYITDEELRALYSTCSLFVFPSFYEGFGLPLLEAMACGAPAIASNQSSLPEILGVPDQLFDPSSNEDIARVMQRILSNEPLRKRAAEESLQQALTFTWNSVAQKIADVFADYKPLDRTTILFNRINHKESKIQAAYFSPLKPLKSGISDYSQDLLPVLTQHFDLDLYHDEGYSPQLTSDHNLYSYTQFEKQALSKEYEALIYQIGNSEFHFYMYAQLARYSGISVLHDYYLGGLINAISLFRPELGVTLAGELKHNYGEKKTSEILDLLQRQKLDISQDFPRLGIYLNRRIFTRSLGVIVHSVWAYKMAIKAYAYDNECIVHIPIEVPPFPIQQSVQEVRFQLGIPTESTVISTLGFVHQTKRALPILSAFKKYVAHYPSAYLVYAGGTEYLEAIDLNNEIKKLGLEKQVKVTGFISSADFHRYIAASDICLNLRFPFNGESSASLVRTLSARKPTVVTDIGSFADFPDDVVFKIPQPDQADEVEEIFKALLILTENSECRASLGTNAEKYVTREHAPERCARLYADFVKQVLRSRQAKRKLLVDHVGRELASHSTDDAQALLTCFAKAIDTN